MNKYGLILAGACAGAVSGLFGGGGGMVLIPLLAVLTDLNDQDIFPASVSVIFPICITSLLIGGNLPSLKNAFPYLVGSLLGGITALFLEKKIPTKWLHRILGIFILWGGIRYLC